MAREVADEASCTLEAALAIAQSIVHAVGVAIPVTLVVVVVLSGAHLVQVAVSHRGDQQLTESWMTRKRRNFVGLLTLDTEQLSWARGIIESTSLGPLSWVSRTNRLAISGPASDFVGRSR